jgi:hypothetical protein
MKTPNPKLLAGQMRADNLANEQTAKQADTIEAATVTAAAIGQNEYF